ncbi:TetR/AcrR family transcriptional regulator [Streptomyces armeniacus]|uniref:TetR/AcrR family transcriptional regulator n=1 Tax=Streptomyces armeniacus TaxID=83291 RepID=A0A345XNB8_9ACTN|nr:TetR/AcrR family transcriptional regulator [Streptomyces armeniacus]AXK33134.1 TetR/AcrR family transcriptional regulator [Streptomyces armeniacus]
MARVSQAHLDARRQQILDGASRCFTRNGFHATSMQDVFQETGLSSGAVYRYFRSKDELIKAVAIDAFGSVRESFARATQGSPDRPLEDVISGVLGNALAEQARQAGIDDSSAYAKLILQVWGETLRDKPLAAALTEGYEEMRLVWADLIRTYQEAGRLRTDVPVDDIVRTLMAVAQGFIVQQAMFGGVTSDTLRNGLLALSTAPAPTPAPAPVPDGDTDGDPEGRPA